MENKIMRIDEIRAIALKEIKAAGLSPRKASPIGVRAGKGQPLASYFDHTLLKAEAGKDAYAALCRDAREYRTASVCVPSNRVALAAELLAGSGVKVCTVVGFPLGYALSAAKAEETRAALAEGCEEFDTVIPIGMLKDGDIVGVFRDVGAVVEAAEGRLVKVILEMCLLGEEEKILAGVLSLLAGAHMLKTSTGFAASGASVEDVKLLRLMAGESAGVKAAGGIRDFAAVKAFLEAGADRIGASATGKILSEAR